MLSMMRLELSSGGHHKVVLIVVCLDFYLRHISVRVGSPRTQRLCYGDEG